MMELATFANGCFWCTEAVMQRLRGVKSVVSGYTGGRVKNPTYEQVSTGSTGHAEAVQVVFDPEVISFEVLLEIFFATCDPTSLNKQGNDEGTQYRTAIFFHSEAQEKAALKAKEKIPNCVTEIIPAQEFYPAEDYHQKYYNLQKNNNPYCRIVIDPKIKKLIQQFSKFVTDEA